MTGNTYLCFSYLSTNHIQMEKEALVNKLKRDLGLSASSRRMQHEKEDVKQTSIVHSINNNCNVNSR